MRRSRWKRYAGEPLPLRAQPPASCHAGFASLPPLAAIREDAERSRGDLYPPAGPIGAPRAVNAPCNPFGGEPELRPEPGTTARKDPI